MSVARATLGLGLAVVVAGCATARQEDDMNELQQSVEAYNHAFRWKNYERAAGFLSPALRGPFIAAHEDDSKSLHVEDFRVVQVNLPAKDAAAVTVNYRYTLLPSVTVENKKVQQNWHKVAGVWVLESEVGSIRELDMAKAPRNPNAFGGGEEEEGQAELEVTGPDGKPIGEATMGPSDEDAEEPETDDS